MPFKVNKPIKSFVKNSNTLTWGNKRNVLNKTIIAIGKTTYDFKWLSTFQSLWNAINSVRGSGYTSATVLVSNKACYLSYNKDSPTSLHPDLSLHSHSISTPYLFLPLILSPFCLLCVCSFRVMLL